MLCICTYVHMYICASKYDTPKKRSARSFVAAAAVRECFCLLCRGSVLSHDARLRFVPCALCRRSTDGMILTPHEVLCVCFPGSRQRLCRSSCLPRPCWDTLFLGWEWNARRLTCLRATLKCSLFAVTDRRAANSKTFFFVFNPSVFVAVYCW